MISSLYLAVLDGVNVDRHDLEVFPEAGIPRKVPEGVPDPSPRTIIRSPATRTSLISHFRSGKIAPRFLNPPMTFSRGKQASLPRGAASCADFRGPSQSPPCAARLCLSFWRTGSDGARKSWINPGANQDRRGWAQRGGAT